MLEKIDKISIQDWKSARKMINLIESYVNTEPEDLRPDSQQNTSLMFLIRCRIPGEWFLKYKLWLSEKNWNMVPSNFLMWANAFIEAQAETTEWNSQESIRTTKPSKARIRFEQQHEVVLVGEGRIHLNKTEPCINCDSTGHTVKNCEDFHYMTPDQRRSFILEKTRCLLCFGISHLSTTCYSSNKCRICFGKHHTLVHIRMEVCRVEQVQVESSSSDSEPEFVEYVNLQFMHKENGIPDSKYDREYINMEHLQPQVGHPTFSIDRTRQWVTALAFSIVAVKNPITKKVVLVNALLDTGANSTSVSKKLGQLLLLDSQKENYTVEVSGGDIKRYQTKICHIRIGDRKGKHWRDVAARILPHPCGSLRSPDWNNSKHWFPHLQNLQLPTPVNSGIADVIIGTDCMDLMRAIKPDTFMENWMPILRHTLLGPVPIGMIDPSQSDRSRFSTLQHVLRMELK